jgi:hypothetical protein
MALKSLALFFYRIVESSNFQEIGVQKWELRSPE